MHYAEIDISCIYMLIGFFFGLPLHLFALPLEKKGIFWRNGTYKIWNISLWFILFVMFHAMKKGNKK